MHRNVQVGLIAAIVITVAAAIALTQVFGDDPPASPEGTATPQPSATGTIPTSTSVPTATSTPLPPTPTPTPQPPDGAAKAMALLVSEGKAVPADLRVVSYARVDWPDASLDCPEPGKAYAQVVTPGWRIVLDNAGEEIEFHSDEPGELLFNCTERWASLEDTVNVFEIEGLAGTSLIEFERFNFETQAFEKINEESNPQAIQDFLDILDGPVETYESDGCQSVFRLTFHTPSREVQIESICPGNTQMVRGDSSGWGGQDGLAPTEFGDLVARYIPDTGIPSFPAN